MINTVSDVLKSHNLKLLFFVFFNLGSNENNEYFEFRIKYRASKFATIEITNKLLNENNNLISKYTGLIFSVSNKEHISKIKNDIGQDRNSFLNTIYKNIEKSRFEYESAEFEEILYSSLFGFRGSMDISRNYYSVDLLEKNISNDYINHILSLLISIDGAKQLNLNFRELQPQYGINKKRNTQIRVNLKWFFDKFGNNIGEINKYKKHILDNKRKEILVMKVNSAIDDNFLERLLFYKNQIINSSIKELPLSEEQFGLEILTLRSKLFHIDELENNQIERRNSTIVKLAKASLPDECSACKDKYKINDRTFLKKDTTTPYLEIHHVISFGSKNKSDVLENLVKLCPSCHRALTPNISDNKYQKHLISNILKNNILAEKYLDNFFDNIPTENEKIDFVFRNLC